MSSSSGRFFSVCLFLILAAGAPPDLWARGPQQRPAPKAEQAALSRSAAASESIFGVQIDGPLDEAQGLGLAVSAGAQWLRYDAFDWDRIEPEPTSPATYRWDQVDEAGLLRAIEKGLKIIAVVKYVPPWAQKVPGSACGPIHPQALYRFAAFLSALVTRYQAPPFNIRYWQLNNEPDAPVWPGRTAYGCWGDQNDPYYGGGYYAQMLKKAYPAIKAADPRAKVLIGGLLLDNPNESPKNPARFLEGILRAGGGPFFDMVAFHGYAEMGDVPEQVRNINWPGAGTPIWEKGVFLRKVLGRFKLSGKPMICTEAALHCMTESPECLETQAAFVPRAYAEGIALGLSSVIFYALKCEYRFLGLLRPDNSPRPSYRAYQTAASFLSRARYQGTAKGYPAGIAGHSFVPPTGGKVDLIWSSDGAPKEVPLPAGVKAYDRYGAEVSPGGRTLRVGYSPLYLQKP
jgi:hypothetical protein